jgi:hypothetical protein
VSFAPDVDDAKRASDGMNHRNPITQRCSAIVRRERVTPRSGGGGNCTYRSYSSSGFDHFLCKINGGPWVGNRSKRETPTPQLVGMTIRWPTLPSPITHVTLALARIQIYPRRALERPKTCARRSDDTDARSEYGEQRLSVEIVMWRSESPTG